LDLFIADIKENFIEEFYGKLQSMMFPHIDPRWLKYGLKNASSKRRDDKV
jgi:hypothetical protein